MEGTTTAKARGLKPAWHIPECRRRLAKEAGVAGREEGWKGRVARLRSKRVYTKRAEELRLPAPRPLGHSPPREVWSPYQHHVTEEEARGGWESFPGWPCWPRAELGQESLKLNRQARLKDGGGAGGQGRLSAGRLWSQQSRSPKLCTYDTGSLEARGSHTALCSQAPAILEVRPLASSRSALL